MSKRTLGGKLGISPLQKGNQPTQLLEVSRLRNAQPPAVQQLDLDARQ